MSPDFEKLKIFYYFLPSSSKFFDTDHITTLLKIFSIRKMNLAVKYDYYWTDLEFNPESDDEVGDLLYFFQRYGTVLKRHPFVWHFQKKEPLKRVAHSFLNACQMVFTNVKATFDVNSIKGGSDNDIASFWKNKVPYFLIGIDDYSGFYFLSSTKEEIVSFKNDLKKG